VYLDASVLVPAFIDQASSTAVDAFLADCSEELLISEFAAAEVASAVSRLVRLGDLDTPSGTAALTDFDVWRAATCSPLDVIAADVRLAHTYVRRFDLRLRAPDALHLAPCRRLDATLVTLDRRLETAAQALGIAVHLPHP
jgi:predicted nucleic acid-binding protein